MGEDDVLAGSVIGFLVAAVVGLRVTNGDLTVVEALVVDAVLIIGELVLSSTENVVTSMSSADSVVGSTFTIKSVGVGLGRGAFVVST